LLGNRAASSGGSAGNGQARDCLKIAFPNFGRPARSEFLCQSFGGDGRNRPPRVSCATGAIDGESRYERGRQPPTLQCWNVYEYVFRTYRPTLRRVKPVHARSGGRRMTDGLYLTDAYLREFDGRITAVDGSDVILDRTAFYPEGGGQPSDAGVLTTRDGASVPVLSAAKSKAGILHRVEGAVPAIGETIHGVLDWKRRYSCMRYHTCLHILSGVVYHRFGSDITGGQIYLDRARMDLSIPNFDRAVAEQVVREVNEVVERNLPIAVRFVPLDELSRNPGLVRVDPQLVPEVDELRVIDIQGFDAQADGGTHLRSTAEVGPVLLQKVENKGARNKRLYLTLGAATAPGP
jgi:misacylated tRNA(Ala) deacylase